MEDRHGGRGPDFYTVGHSNHPPDRFLALLAKHGIEVLADTRSHPYSRHAPHFNAPAVAAGLRRAGIRYLPLGRSLGGRPQERRFYDGRGRVDYGLLGGSEGFLGGIRRLMEEARTRRVALMCSEEDPRGCHRRLLVGRALERRGARVLHIRGDGGLAPESELDGAQPALFPEAEEEARRSTR